MKRLGNCETPVVDGCHDDWAGATFGGEFTVDISIPAFTEYRFFFLSGQSGWSWYLPRLPAIWLS
jgi:hypothetical protein